MARRALSLHARQLLAASLGLVAFLGFTGVALDEAFRQTAISNLHERLEQHAYAYLGDFEFTRDGELIEPAREQAPDKRFSQPGSGLYAVVRGRSFHWTSPSAAGRTLPEPEMLKPAERRFEELPLAFVDDKGIAHQVYRFSYGLAWEQGEVGQTPTVTRFTIALYEDAEGLERQVGVFRRALWKYLGLATVLLLLVQMAVLRWSLQPLRQLEATSRACAAASAIAFRPPSARLQQITDSINALIEERVLAPGPEPQHAVGPRRIR
jgi:two-component system sensor histidine kinase PhoQ